MKKIAIAIAMLLTAVGSPSADLVWSDDQHHIVDTVGRFAGDFEELDARFRGNDNESVQIYRSILRF